MVSFPERITPVTRIKPTNHERALKTYQELQKRKEDKAKKVKQDVQAFRQDTFYKCLAQRHDLRAYR